MYTVYTVAGKGCPLPKLRGTYAELSDAIERANKLRARFVNVMRDGRIVYQTMNGRKQWM